jgi:flagellar export protein FliJ
VKRFAFSLEKARKLRAYAETEAKAEAGRAASALRETEERLAALEAEAFSARSTRPSLGADIAAEMLNYQRYSARLRAEKAALAEAREEAAAREAEAREAWSEAKAALKPLDNLKERQAADYRKNNEQLAVSNEQ